MAKTKQPVAHVFSTPLGNLISGLCLFAIAYGLFSIALGSGSYWQWAGCFVSFGYGISRIFAGFRTLAKR